jgi:hypothetical protein
LFTKKVSGRRFQETIKVYREEQAREASHSSGSETEKMGPVTEVTDFKTGSGV